MIPGNQSGCKAVTLVKFGASNCLFFEQFWSRITPLSIGHNYRNS